MPAAPHFLTNSLRRQSPLFTPDRVRMTRWSARDVRYGLTNFAIPLAVSPWKSVVSPGSTDMNVASGVMVGIIALVIARAVRPVALVLRSATSPRRLGVPTMQVFPLQWRWRHCAARSSFASRAPSSRRWLSSSAARSCACRSSQHSSSCSSIDGALAVVCFFLEGTYLPHSFLFALRAHLPAEDTNVLA